MRWPPSFETPSSLLASSALGWASLLSESSLLPASLSVALSAFLAAVLSAFLAAILVVLSFLSPFSPLSPVSLLSVLAPLLPWSALVAFVLPAAFSGLAALSLQNGDHRPIGRIAKRARQDGKIGLAVCDRGRTRLRPVGGDKKELNLIVFDGELVAQHLHEFDVGAASGPGGNAHPPRRHRDVHCPPDPAP